MDVFEKLKSSISDFSKVSAETAREGIEKLSEKSTEFIVLNKAKMEKKSIEKKIEDSYTELGNEFHAMYNSKKLKKSSSDLKEFSDKIDEYKAELHKQKIEIHELYSKLSPETLKKEKINSLTELLDDGGCTIEQLRIEKNSPIAGKRLKNIKLPKQVLVGVVQRGDETIIPDGTFGFQVADQITLLGKKDDVENTITKFNPPKE